MKHRLAFWTGLTVAAAATLAWGGMTMAADGSAYVIGSTNSQVKANVVESHELLEVRRAPGCVVYLNPQSDYVRGNQNHNPIDENHFIIRSKQLAASLSNPGVVIIHGGQSQAQNAGSVQPIFIIGKPGEGKENPEMPTVPQPAAAAEKKLVAAE